MNRHQHGRRQRGFTLIEVLVALLVTAVGLLGLLKIQALAISSTRESGSRGLVAAQVESLTAIMHANPFYWAAVAPPGGVSVAPPASIFFSGTTLPAPFNTVVSSKCGTACTPVQLAAWDMQTWAASMYSQFPTYTTTIKCTATMPINCGIYVTWQENRVAINSTTSTNAAETLSFSVYVQP